MSGSRASSKVAIVAEHIYHVLGRHAGLHAESSHIAPVPPLFVALQGPQGIGKTTLTTSLQDELRSVVAQKEGRSAPPFRADAGLTPSPRRPTVAVLSLDDFYLPHSSMATLANTSSTAAPSDPPEEESLPKTSKLLSGRGLPGTHDLPLLASVLASLSRINSPRSSPSLAATAPKAPTPSAVTFPRVDAPIYDKSAFAGKGDRKTEPNTINGPVDVVLLEGWCMGFYPLSKSELQRRWSRVSGAVESASNPARDAAGGPGVREVPEADLERGVIKRLGITAADIMQINDHLREYSDKIYPFFTGGFIQLAPPPTQPYSLIYGWRLEQEHWMKAHNGGRGMTDDEVKSFVDRYIPGYIFFGDGVTNGFVNDDETENKRATMARNGLLRDVDSEVPNTPWAGNGLRVVLDGQRDLVNTESF